MERATEADSSGEEWPPDWWPVLAVAFRDSYDADPSGVAVPTDRCSDCETRSVPVASNSGLRMMVLVVMMVLMVLKVVLKLGLS